MKMTCSEVKNDAKKIVDTMVSSDRVIPSLFSPLRRISFHLALFLIFCLMDYLILNKNNDGEMIYWMFSFGFGALNWVLIFAFFCGYENLFSMIGYSKISELELVKLIRGKIKLYGIVWFVIIAILGFVSILDKLNIDILVFGNFAASLALLFIFSVDMSRYQLSMLMGTLKAASEKLNR